jgi:hypothetical protein
LTTSAQFSGIRVLSFTGLGAMSLTPGQYVLGLGVSEVGTASNSIGLLGAPQFAIAGYIHPGTNSTAATATNSYLAPFHGVFNATSGAMPSAVGLSSISGGNAANSPQFYFGIRAI